MNQLSDEKCEVCRKGAPVVTQEQMIELMPTIPAWALVNIDGVNRLSRTFTFNNFVDAIAFTNSVAEIAEAENHHPEIVTEWGKVKVSWWTHKINGLHRNDFIMVAKTDSLLYR